MSNIDNNTEKYHFNIFRYLIDSNKKNHPASLIYSLKRTLIISLLIIILSLISAIIFITYKYSGVFYDQINKNLYLVENELEDQIDNASGILNRASEHLSYLIDNNNSKDEIERFLASLEPVNLSKTYWSTFIVTDKNSHFKASSKYSTPENIQYYNKELITRDYITKSKDEPLKLHVGKIVSGIQTKKLSIPMGFGFVNKHNEYLGTVLTGLVIEDFIKDLSKEDIIKISLTNLIPNSKSIEEYNRFTLLQDILFSPTLTIHYKLKSIPEFIEISFNRDFYTSKLVALLISIILILSIIIILTYLVIKYLYKNIISPIENIENKINTFEQFSPIYDSQTSLSSQPIEIQKIEAIIKRLIHTDDELKNVKSIVKFLSQEKIKEIEKFDPKGMELFGKIEGINNYINNKKASNENEIPSENLLKELYNSIENFYGNINASEDSISWQLFNNMDKLSQIIEDKNTNLTDNTLSNEFNIFHNLLIKFYKEKIEFSPYILHKNYFANLEESANYNIQNIIEELLKKSDSIKKSNFQCNIHGDLSNLHIRKKAFEISFIYAIEAIQNYHKNSNDEQIFIDVILDENNKQNFKLNFSIHPSSDSKALFTEFDQNDSKLNDLVKINLYGAKIFAAFNNGIVRIALIENSNLQIEIGFIQNNLQNLLNNYSELS